MLEGVDRRVVFRTASAARVMLAAFRSAISAAAAAPALAGRRPRRDAATAASVRLSMLEV